MRTTAARPFTAATNKFAYAQAFTAQPGRRPGRSARTRRPLAVLLGRRRSVHGA